jgi:septum site-determining protein MinD
MLAIAGGKGGCGKTTTTLGLAGALAQRGFDPLVIDGDCDMPDVHHRVGLPRSNGVDALADGQPLRDVIVRSEQLHGAAILTGGRRDSLDVALRQVGRWEGPVLVDCSAGANRDSLRPLRHADRAVIVSTHQPQCIQDAALTRTIAERLSTRPAGVVLRSTPDTDPSSAGIPPEWNVLGRLAAVERPLADSQIRSEWQRISETVFPTGRHGGQRNGETTGKCVGHTSDNRNHQRYFRRNI